MENLANSSILFSGKGNSIVVLFREFCHEMVIESIWNGNRVNMDW